MKIDVRMLMAMVVAFAALAAQSAEITQCWEPAEEQIEGLGGEKAVPTLVLS